MQKELAVRLRYKFDGGNNDIGEEAQREALLDALASVIFAPTGDQRLSCGLIHFLAVLGIDAYMGRLRKQSTTCV
jgi:hypothetical protein